MDGPRDFYQALHRAFDTTLAAQGRQPQLLAALAGQAFDSYEGNAAQAAATEPPVACARGCAACCQLRVSATAPEVLVVARFLRAVAGPLAQRGIDLNTALRQADDRTRGLSEPARLAMHVPCPFIAQGACVIYAVRPLACRGHASQDAHACAEAVAGRRQQVPFSRAQRDLRSLVQNAMQSALRDAGLAWASYEFLRALRMALDNDEAEAQWLRGEDPFAAAALHDVPADEMARVFDQLRPPQA